MPNMRRLIELLADGHFHSGEQLGFQLGVSRASIWKSLGKLEQLGIGVQAVHGRGYRLAAPLELLNDEQIISALSPTARGLLHGFELLDQVDSTNSYLLQCARSSDVDRTICISEFQTAGRGRRGRKWVSPYGSNLYLSLLWRFDCGPASLGRLSLAVAVGIYRALKQLGVQGTTIKWPNDLLLNGRKLAGLLLEVSGEAGGPSRAVVGVGINFAMPPASTTDIDQPWSELRTDYPELGRNQLAAAVISELTLTMERYAESGFEEFREEWEAADAFRDQEVIVVLGEQQIEGIARGIDEVGQLVIQCGEEMRHFSAGEISLRRSEQ